VLIDEESANEFLDKYKAVIAFFNDGEYPECVEDYAYIRSSIYENIESIEEHMLQRIGESFFQTIKAGNFGDFVYLKRYKQGHILKHVESGVFYQVLCLTTPLDEIVPEFTYIKTALLPYKSKIVCDGLIVGSGLLIGKNMAKELRDEYWEAKRSGALVTCA
jgi:hypothetical protein